MHWWLLCEFIVLFVLIFLVVANVNSVWVLNGTTNFKDWKENMQIVMGWPCIKDWETPSPTDLSTSHRGNCVRSGITHSNRMSLMIIKHDIPEVFRSSVSDDITSAKEFLTEMVSYSFSANFSTFTVYSV